MINKKVIQKLGQTVLCCGLLWIVACKNTSSTDALIEMDLMKDGLPIKILAPADAEVVASDMGFIKDVTVKGDDNYYIQIMAGSAHITDMTVLIRDKLNEIKNSPFFTEIVKEDENGFIYKKTISEDRINYDFRYIKIQGDQEYVFQTGLIGQFTLEDVEKMYEAVK